MLKTTKVKIDQEKFSFLVILFKRKNSMFTKHFPIGKRFGSNEANIKQLKQREAFLKIIFRKLLLNNLKKISQLTSIHLNPCVPLPPPLPHHHSLQLLL